MYVQSSDIRMFFYSLCLIPLECIEYVRNIESSYRTHQYFHSTTRLLPPMR